MRESNIGPFGGEVFINRKNFESRIKEIVAFSARSSGRKERMFESRLLGEALRARHHRFRSLEKVPTQFGFIRNSQLGIGRPGSSLSVLLDEWVRFSYKDLVCPAFEFTLPMFSKVCRERFAIEWREKKKSSAYCELCQAGGEVDVDHVSPSHAQIRDACWNLLNDNFESLKDEWWKLKCDPTNERPAYWKKGHPLTELYDTMTTNGTYQTLCKPCHREVSAKRKKRPNNHQNGKE